MAITIINSKADFAVIENQLKTALSFPQGYFNDVIGVLCFVLERNTVEGASSIQQNINDIKEFFPVCVRNPRNEWWKYSLDATVNGSPGIILMRPKLINGYNYVQITFRDPVGQKQSVHALKSSLGIGDRMIFIKKKDSPNYEVYSIPLGSNPFNADLEDFVAFNDPIKDTSVFVMPPVDISKKYPLNQILFGAPGTGKTHNAINHALSIIKGYDLKELIKLQHNNKANRLRAKEEFDELMKVGQIQFVTFHQSYSYEEFIEGIRPSVKDKEVEYNIEPGIFKKLCEIATKKLSFDFEEIYEQFMDDLKVTGVIQLKTTKRPRPFAVSILDDTLIATNTRGTTIELSKEAIKDFFEKGILGAWHDKSYIRGLVGYLKEEYAAKITPIDNTQENFVLIIDEINRGNVSRIFGELITLIEESKRIGNEEELRIKLTYSGATREDVEEVNEMFGVPKNIYIIGTMNTADKSIALVDLALRRRFTFIEYSANPDLLNTTSDGIDLKKMLQTINDRIEFLLDKDHFIGHAYFMGKNNKEEVLEVFKNKIIPLLQEYFYNDFKKITWILGDHDKWKGKERNGLEDKDSFRLIRLRKGYNPQEIFGFPVEDDFEGKKDEMYYINTDLADSIFSQPKEALIYIYNSYVAEEAAKAKALLLATEEAEKATAVNATSNT